MCYVRGIDSGGVKGIVDYVIGWNKSLFNHRPCVVLISAFYCSDEVMEKSLPTLLTRVRKLISRPKYFYIQSNAIDKL